MSDTHDEIDWEWSGNDFASPESIIQTNFFGKGITGDWDRGTLPKVGKNMTQNFMTYTLDWKPDSLTWSIDGQVVRTLHARDTDSVNHQYPQTPSRFHLGVWDAGREGSPWYTVQWAGGNTDMNGFPYSMFVKSVAVTPYRSCVQYNFTDTSGSSASVACLNDTILTSPTGSESGTGDIDAAHGTVASSIACTTPTPENTQPGTASGCARYYDVKAGDTCESIAKTAGIGVKDLLKWNPRADENCWNLWANYAICVSPPGQCDDAATISAPAPTAETGTEKATPTSSLPEPTDVVEDEVSTLTTSVPATEDDATDDDDDAAGPTHMPTTTTSMTSAITQVDDISSSTAAADLPAGSMPFPGSDAAPEPTEMPSEDLESGDEVSSPTEFSSTSDLPSNDGQTATSASIDASPPVDTAVPIVENGDQDQADVEPAEDKIDGSAPVDAPATTTSTTAPTDSADPSPSAEPVGGPGPVAEEDGGDANPVPGDAESSEPSDLPLEPTDSPLSSVSSSISSYTSMASSYMQLSTSAPSSTSSAAASTSDKPAASAITCPESDGAIYTSGDGTQFEITCDSDFLGGDLKYLDKGREKPWNEACANECAKTTDCKGFSAVGFNCYLKRTLGRPKAYKGCVGGRKLS